MGRTARPKPSLTQAALALCWSLGGCGSEVPVSPLAIRSVAPACPRAGETLNVSMSGGEGICPGARVSLAGRTLPEVRVKRDHPLTLAAGLPLDFTLVPGAALEVVCGETRLTAHPFAACPGPPALPEVRAADPTRHGVAPQCAQAIDAVLELVDRSGLPFPRDHLGIFQVPIASDDFSLDASGSRNVTPRNATHTFSSDCLPTLTTRAPVLGNLSAAGMMVGQHCTISVEIADWGCLELRHGRTQAQFVVVR